MPHVDGTPGPSTGDARAPVKVPVDLSVSLPTLLPPVSGQSRAANLHPQARVRTDSRAIPGDIPLRLFGASGRRSGGHHGQCLDPGL